MNKDKKTPWYLRPEISDVIQARKKALIKPSSHWEYLYVIYLPIKFVYECIGYNNNKEEIEKFIYEIGSKEFKETEIYRILKDIIDSFNHQSYVTKFHILTTIIESTSDDQHSL